MPNYVACNLQILAAKDKITEGILMPKFRFVYSYYGEKRNIEASSGDSNDLQPG